MPNIDPTRRILLHGLLIFSIGCAAATSADAAGETAAPFLAIDVGARALGFGGAYAPLSLDETALYWNPAGLALIDGPLFGATHAAWYEGLDFEWAGGATPLGMRGGVGIAATFLHAAPIAGYDESGQPTGDFTSRDIAVSVGGGYSFSETIALGAAVKGIQQSIAGETATGFAGDVGLLAGMRGWRFGATVRNIGPGIRFGDESFPLPFGVTAGVAKAFGSGGLVGASFASGAEPEARVGTEWTWNRLLAFRAGYRAGIDGDDPSSGFTAGAGVRRSGWSVDYAMTPHEELGAAHRVSLSLRFGRARDGAAPRQVCGADSRESLHLADVLPAAPPTGFRLCTTSRHSTVESARAEARSIRLVGLGNAEVVPEGNTYRVLVGFFGNREEALARAEALRAVAFPVEVVEP